MVSIYNGSTHRDVGSAPTGNSVVNALIGGTKWGNGGLGFGAGVTFSFPTQFVFSPLSITDGSFSYPGEVSSGQALSATQQQAARDALQKWANVANLTFSEVADTPDTGGFGDNSSVGTIRFAESDSPDTAWAYTPGDFARAGDVWFNRNDYNSPTLGSYAFYTFMHEIGHALGLEHPHENDDGDTMSLSVDAISFSLMSYRDFVGDDTGGVNSSFLPTTPMLYDVRAIQTLYGANYSYNSANTVYSWTTGTRIYETIWDGGGADTINAANQTEGVILVLEPGTYSTIGAQQWDGQAYVRNHLAIAFDTWIENAVGTALADVIRGNVLANDLRGGAGDDLLRGSDWTYETADGNDSLYGDAGRDVMEGDYGNDWMFGGEDADTVSGQDGNDLVYGDPGDDFVIGDFADASGSGHDTLRGGAGFDVLIGGGGNDDLDGGIDSDSLRGGMGNDTLTGGAGGSGADTMDGGLGDDYYYVAEAGDVAAEQAGGGVDTVVSRIDWTLSANLEVLTLTGATLFFGVNGTGNASDNRINGDRGSNQLFGLGGNDFLGGGEGYDTLDGGAGNDVLEGGAGNDTASYASAVAGVLVSLAITAPQETSGAGRDLLTDIESLAGSPFNDTLAGNLADNTLHGNGGYDQLAGDEGKDRLYGDDGADTLAGGGGADTLDGGGGADSLNGGLGDDLYLVDDERDSAAESAGGLDTVVSAVSHTLGAGIEYLALTGAAAVNGTGNGADNLLDGNAAANTLAGMDGNDTLYGRDGNDSVSGGGGNDSLLGDAGRDTLEGGAGDDWVDGGEDVDTVSYAHAVTAVTVSLLAAGAQATGGAGTDALTAIENLVGSIGGDTLGGNAADNVLLGLFGNDAIDGAGGADNLFGDIGNDSLAGGAGTDVLDGGVGDDLLDGGTDADTASYAYAAGAVSVSLLLAGAQNTGAGGTDTLLGIENLRGSLFDDTLAGSAAANLIVGEDGDDAISGSGSADTLSGGAGNDTLNGEAGADRMDGGDGDDLYIVNHAGDVVAEAREDAPGGTDGVRASVNHALGFGIEALTLSGTAAINGTGNALANRIDGNAAANIVTGLEGDDAIAGNAGADTLRGGEGNDSLLGGSGGDALFGGANDDLLEGGDGDDALDGGGDTDTVSYASAGGGVSVNLLLSGAQITGGAGTDTLAGIENVTGSRFNDSLTGNAAANLLQGFDGSDKLSAGGGADRLDGGARNDTLDGGGGSDTLSGGDGMDLLAGRAGADAFVFDTRLGNDRVTDFLSGTDHFVFSQAALPVGNGDTVIDAAVSTGGPGGFSALAELVLVTGDVVGAITRASASAVIGSADSAYAVADTRLFAVDNGIDTALFLFSSGANDAWVEAAELTLLCIAAGTSGTVLADYLFAA